MSAQLLAIMLWALAQVETPHGVPAEPGPAGETGRWQLTPAVRADRARDLRARLGAGRVFTDRELAEEQVRWLERELRTAGVDPQPFNIALAWNAGIGHVLRSTSPERSYQFAGRVVNTMEAKP